MYCSLHRHCNHPSSFGATVSVSDQCNNHRLAVTAAVQLNAIHCVMTASLVPGKEDSQQLQHSLQNSWHFHQTPLVNTICYCLQSIAFILVKVFFFHFTLSVSVLTLVFGSLKSASDHWSVHTTIHQCSMLMTHVFDNETASFFFFTFSYLISIVCHWTFIFSMFCRHFSAIHSNSLRLFVSSFAFGTLLKPSWKNQTQIKTIFFFFFVTCVTFPLAIFCDIWNLWLLDLHNLDDTTTTFGNSMNFLL